MADSEPQDPLLGRQYFLEDVFDDFEEYQQYLTRALSLFREQDKRRNPTLQKYVPEHLDVKFNKTIKSPRLYFPRFRGTIIVELPDNNLAPKKKKLIRSRALERYTPLVKINELACADEFAMRLKIMERKK